MPVATRAVQTRVRPYSTIALKWGLSNSIEFKKLSVASAFGAAAGLISLLIWTFYSSQTFFFGAEFVYVWCEVKGRPIQPATDAV